MCPTNGIVVPKLVHKLQPDRFPFANSTLIALIWKTYCKQPIHRLNYTKDKGYTSINYEFVLTDEETEVTCPSCRKYLDLQEKKKMETVSKLLSSALVVSSAAFAKLGAAKQTEVLASANGKPIVFVDNFFALTNKKRLIDKLLAGDDVSVELEFNELDLSADELKVIKEVRPILEKIRGFKLGSYDWVIPTDAEERLIEGIQIGTGPSIRNATGYTIGKKALEALWKKASVWFAGGEKAGSYYVNASGYNRQARFLVNANGQQYIEVGCQNISRAEIEFVAKAMNWNPVLPE